MGELRKDLTKDAAASKGATQLPHCQVEIGERRDVRRRLQQGFDRPDHMGAC